MKINKYLVVGANADNDSGTQLLVDTFEEAVFASTAYYGLIEGLGYPSVIGDWVEGHLEGISRWDGLEYAGYSFRPVDDLVEESRYILTHHLPVYKLIGSEWVNITDKVLAAVKNEFAQLEGYDA